MDQEAKVANFVVQLFKITTDKQGGGRIQFDFGAESLDEIQKIQKANGRGGMNFALAVVPYKESYTDGLEPNEYGEIEL